MSWASAAGEARSIDWAPLWLSLRIASVSTVVTLVAGTACALALSWRRLPARDLVDAIISAPMVLPSVNRTSQNGRGSGSASPRRHASMCPGGIFLACLKMARGSAT